MDKAGRISLVSLLTALRRLVETRLTDRQRVAIRAELEGVPKVVIAERLGINRNARVQDWARRPHETQAGTPRRRILGLQYTNQKLTDRS